MVQWTKLLKNVGFTESETKTYITALETGAASVQDLARKARISRVTTYAAIETLTKEGLMGTVQKGKKTLYLAESPERLLSVAQGRSKQMEGIIKEIEYHINDLRLVQRGEKPVVRIFEGHEAVKTIQDDLLRSRIPELWELLDAKALYSLYTPEELRPAKDELGKRKTIGRGFLYFGDAPPTRAYPTDMCVALPGNTPQFFGDIILYGNKVGLSTLRGKQISVLIESEDIARTMRVLFELAWKGRERPNGGA